jgi:hypothetical protein
MKKWAEQNPEEAAELRVHVFGVDQDSTQEWIKLQNKKRKMRTELTTKQSEIETKLTTKQAELAAEKEQAERVVLAFRPVADLWGGIGRQEDGSYKPDFESVDAAFMANTKGLSIDDYVRIRARNRVPANSDVLRIRAENARLQRELEAAKTKETGAAALPAASPPVAVAAAAPVDLSAKWGEEIPKAHKLRQIAGWEEKLEAAMDRYHDADLDEYSRDPEDVADSVLKRELAALAADDDAEPEPAKKKAPAVKVSAPKKKPPADDIEAAYARAGKGEAPKTHKNGHHVPDEAPAGFAERERWALERARKRMRGELAE